VSVSAAGLVLLRERRRRAAMQSESPFIDADPVRWIETHFWIPELRGPMLLAPYQRTALRDALHTTDGTFDYSAIVWSDIKKSAKSSIAAAVCLWRAFQVEWGSILIVANDLKQADSRVGYYLRRAIELNPAMRAVCKIRNYKVELPNHTTIEAIPIDPTGEAGSNADMIVFSELWGADGTAAARMWTELTLSPTKFGQSFRWVETYAGFKDRSVTLWQLYEQAVTPEQRLDADLEMYADPASRLFCLWNTTPRLPWQTPEYYAQEAAVLVPDEFARVHRNQWSDGGTERFLPSIIQWDACQLPLPPLDQWTPLILAADAGVSSDTFALIAVGEHPDAPDGVAVRYVDVYTPQGSPLDYGPIEQDIRDFCTLWNVQELVYDPYQLHDMMTRLKNDGVVETTPFSQGADRLIADKQLLDLITQRRIAHDGNTDLRAHIDHADRKVDGNEGKIRIVKRLSKLKIDLAVALSMAASRWMETQGGEVFTAASGGVNPALEQYRAMMGRR
jgi:hypothetical protein